MAYQKNVWENDITELSAENMNHIEEGIENSQNVELIAISEEAPDECQIGDKYYNNDDNLIYEAIGQDEWSDDGEEPLRGIFYVLLSSQQNYYYDGTTLISVGGGSEEVVISKEQPTTDDWKIWINSDEIANIGSEIESGSDDNGNWIKFADGTMICYGQKKLNVSYHQTANVYTGTASEIPAIIFSKEFVDIPSININVTSDGAYGLVLSTEIQKTNVNKIQFLRPTDTTLETHVCFIAIGRWK